VLLGVVVIVAARRLEHIQRLSALLVRLQDTTAQIRVRGAFLLLLLFAALAARLGLEVILGAFIAGVVLRLVDRDEAMTHPDFQRRLQAVGFGVFIPYFFIVSGMRFDLAALFSGSSLLLVPIFLLALLVVRGLPALLYQPLVGGRRTAAAALLQATSVGFLVVASRIGQDMGLISGANAAAVIAAGLLSVLLFPLGALVLLRGSGAPAAEGLEKGALRLGS
jgi:Kef-type K+ transport system membrane component KefB